MRLPAKLLGGGASLALLFSLFVGPATASTRTIPHGPGVAFLSKVSGKVAVRRADGKVVAGTVNAPLVTGDYLSTGSGARAEVQFDNGHILRVAPNSQLRIREFTQKADVVQLASGRASISVLHKTVDPIEIETTSVAVLPTDPGYYDVGYNGLGQT